MPDPTAPSRDAPPPGAAGVAACGPSVIDVEASGFGRGSYPIEVGCVRDDGFALCMLVRPEAGWTHWDAGAERVHGIDRAVLAAHGRPPREVAQALNAALAGRTVYCDGWAHDYAWLARLFDAGAVPQRFRLESVHALLDASSLARLDAVQRDARTALRAQRHRASNDARALQQALATLLGAPAPAPATAAAAAADSVADPDTRVHRDSAG